MKFESFCAQYESSDNQELKTNNSFVVHFGKPYGTSHSIDPEDIVAFMRFLSTNHQECIDVIETNEHYSKSSYTKYQEKPYRELYKLAEDKGDLKSINSLGRSQTKGLTQVIAKFICYLARVSYTSVDENTHFDKATITSALINVPQDLSSISSSTSPAMPINRKLKFERWLSGKISPKTKNHYSEKSIKSYSGTSINLADKLLKEFNQVDKPLYEVSSVEKVEAANIWLQRQSEWAQKNRDGKNMFQSGLNLYIEFLSETPRVELTRLPKPFILLAGLSGTGKTRFVSEQAKETGNKYCLVPVRPDWHEPSDLLGYVSRLTGKPEYVSTKVLGFIIDAWRAAAPQADASGFGELNHDAEPFWLCLDEMNLAPVEQYFADYLSVLERRKFEDGEYMCEALLDRNILQDLSNDGGNTQSELGLKGSDKLWQCFLNHGIPLPPNLIVAGTVNMDETTHGFSRKVIDRAFTFDFGEFYPNDYDGFFDPVTKPKIFTYSQITQAGKADLSATFDKDGEKTITFLKSVNGVLRRTPFELAYRALNELLLQVACFKPSSEAQLQAVWDDFLMAKVLPRIDGDEDKLRHDGNGNLLHALSELLEAQLSLIWNSNRHDFNREKTDGSAIDDIACRSRAKLQWMSNRLTVNTFTSFWP